jgi:hypothetical protein
MRTNVTIKKILRVFAVIGIASIHNLSSADSLGPFNLIDSKPVSEFWLNPGFYSYHFQTEKNLDNNNIGLGVEYRYSTVNALTAGRFQNSDRRVSSYAAWYWQPLEFGSARIGALFGVIDGYPKANNGAWFPLALPVVSLEYKNIGINITLIPTYKDIVYGSLTVQLRLKVF